jgi:ABC-2 type transport system permease protein
VSAAITAVGTGGRFQLALLRRTPQQLIALAAAPVTALVLVAIVDSAGRRDLSTAAIIAPGLMTMWAMTLFSAGEALEVERQAGTLEPLLATPAPLFGLVLGRVVVTSAVGALGFAECWLVGWALIGTPAVPDRPGLFAVGLLLTVLAMAAWGSVLAPLYLLARSARTFQNSLSFPLYLLGGVLVPIDLYPEWARPICRLVFLTWSAEVLRDGAGVRDASGWAIPLLVVTGSAGLAVGAWMTGRLVLLGRRDGRLGHA